MYVSATFNVGDLALSMRMTLRIWGKVHYSRRGG